MRRSVLLGVVVLGALGALLGWWRGRAPNAGAATPPAAQRPQWVCTQVPAGSWKPASQASGPLQPQQARLVHLSGDPSAPQVRVISKGFVVACDPYVDWQGRLFFAGSKGEGEKMRVWWQRQPGGASEPFGPQDAEAHDPCWLPRDQLIYVARGPWGGWSLWRWTPEKNKTEPITCTPDDALHPHLLQDGRLVFVLQRSGAQRDLFTLQPDGTNLTLFTAGGKDIVCGPPSETWGEERQVVFAADSRLIAAALKRPLQLRQPISLPGVVESTCPLPDGRWLLAYRPPEAKSFGLYRFDPRSGRLDPPLYDDPQFDEIQPVWAGTRPQPKGLLTVVYLKEGVTTGKAYCLNAHYDETRGAPWEPKASRLRVWEGSAAPDGRQRTLLGEVPLQPDGSFYVELPADVPVQWETVDGAGRTVAAHRTWVWVRPSDNQPCVGCHHNPELAPQNVAAQAFIGEPVKLTPGETRAP